MSHRLLEPSARLKLRAVAAAGAAVFVAGLVLAPHRAWAGLLWGNFYFLSLALAGAVFVAILHLSSAGWASAIRRVPEAMTAYLPAGLAAAGALVLGLRELYPWALPGAGADDAVLHAKLPFLSLPSYVALVAVAACCWLLPVRAILARSRRQDVDGDPAHTEAQKRVSALFMVLFGLTFTAACVQWLMSLEPHWYSTIYAWYVFTGLLASGIAAQTLLILALHRRGTLRELRSGHLHDLGKFLFAFSAFWAYLWFSQYLLIWYSNIPDETSHYVARLVPGWRWLFYLNPVVNFVIPFGLLLEARSKKNEERLALAAAIILLGRALDLFLLVMPPLFARGPALPWIECGVFAALGAAYLLFFDRAFLRWPSTPLKDPYLVESLHH